MKTSVTGILTLLAGAFAVHGQGAVSLANYAALYSYIYISYKPVSGSSVPLGGGSTGPPPTLSNYASEIGNGKDWTVQLYGAVGTNVPTSSLLPLPGMTATFSSGFPTDAIPGTWESTAVASFPNAPAGTVATLQLYVWYNEGGAITNFFQALIDDVPAGSSSTANVKLAIPAAALPDFGNFDVGAFPGMAPDRPTIIWTNPAPLIYGAALGASQLDAVAAFAGATVPGSFVYYPPLGTVLTAGTNTLSVIFTPTDTLTYDSAISNTTVLVSPAPLTLTAANETWVMGQPFPALTGTITGVTNGDNITAAYTCSATTNSPVGTYPIMPGLVDPGDRRTNYTVSLVNGTLTILELQTGMVFTRLYSFSGQNSTNGANPEAGLVQGHDGNFYGTTYAGGNPAVNGGEGLGTVFNITPSGMLTSLYSFHTGHDGSGPEAGLAQGSDGNFYGTTSVAGNYGDGTVFKISTNGVYTNLHSFPGYGGGSFPDAGLAQGSNGNFFGTTATGGPGYYETFGTVFEISTNGAWAMIYSFGTITDNFGEPLDGAFPKAGLLLDSNGNFYGTTSGGGTAGYGTVFKINRNGGGLTSLYSFTNGDDGSDPSAGLAQGSDGNFYGTAEAGGAHNYGAVFKIGANGPLTSLYSFTGGNDGGSPVAALVRGSDGNFYGTTANGGSHNQGAVFKITASGALTSLYSFTGGNDGGNPVAGLVQGTDGSFYGTTKFGGGTDNAGTVFRLTIVPGLLAVPLPNSMLSLFWSTAVGGMYQLQYSSNLSSSNWTNLGSATNATGTTLSTTVSTSNALQRFYRVMLLP